MVRNCHLKKNSNNFKNVVKSVMNDASKVLAEMELFSHGAEVEEKLSLRLFHKLYNKIMYEQ